MPFEFIKALTKMMQTKIKGFIHFAIDLMIIFQSGLRFPSSMADIQDKIVLFREKRK